MDVSIIIINYNTFELTSNCIKSIEEKCLGLTYEIILVDNASEECNPDNFKIRFPNIILVKSEINTGFAGGNNLGIASSTGEYILLLNSDTELINNAPKICLEYMTSNKNIGMTTCQLLYPDGSLQFNTRRFRTISWELLEIFPIHYLVSKKKREELMLHHYFDHSRTVKVDWVWGAFMLFPRSVLNEFKDSKLNDDFFMYGEDVLWCLEIKKRGYSIVFLPDAKVMHIHKGSSSSEKLKSIRKQSNKNHATVMKQYYKGWKWHLFAFIFYTKQFLIQLFNKK